MLAIWEYLVNIHHIQLKSAPDMRNYSSSACNEHSKTYNQDGDIFKFPIQVS